MAQQQNPQQNATAETEQDINILKKIRMDKLAELQAAGNDPFTITKYDVPLLKFLECFLTADVVHPDIDLNPVRAVPYINEVCTSHISPTHDSAGDGNDLFLERF